MLVQRYKIFIAAMAMLTLFFPLAVSAAVPVKVPAEVPKARIAVLGGTFLNDVIFYRDGIIKQKFTIDTKVGLSPTIHYAEWQGIPFYYVHAHGEGKWLATWVALYDLGVEEAIGGATAGAINKKMGVYDYIIPDDFIELNVDRPLSIPADVYRDPNAIPLPRFVPAMDTDIRNILLDETKKAVAAIKANSKDKQYKGIKVHDGGVIVQARGGRFETVAEIRMMKQWGGDMVTMSVGTEMAYSRMLGIHYANMIVISNPAEGMGEWDFSLMEELYPRINPLSLDIVLASLPRVAALKGKPRVADGLINHPEMTSQKKKDHP